MTSADIQEFTNLSVRNVVGYLLVAFVVFKTF